MLNLEQQYNRKIVGIKLKDSDQLKVTHSTNKLIIVNSIQFIQHFRLMLILHVCAAIMLDTLATVFL